MSEVILTRIELYDLVWNEPMIAISKRYNISDSGLRKICERLNIPTPKAGYWEKLKWKKPVYKHLLDTNYKGEQSVSLQPIKEGNEKSTDNKAALSKLQKEIEADPGVSLTVPYKLTSPHKLIIDARQMLTDKDAY